MGWSIISSSLTTTRGLEDLTRWGHQATKLIVIVYFIPLRGRRRNKGPKSNSSLASLWSLTMKCARAYYRWLLALPYFLSSVRAATNVTVDDEYGDSETGATPTYSPSSGVWNQGNTCTGCLVKPDSSETFDGTWHDTTWAPNDQPHTITINFTGKDYTAQE